MPITIRLAISTTLLVLLTSCAQYDNQRGVNVAWESDSTNTLVKGQTTRADVLAQLGPPSQIIALQNETVLYYLFEHTQATGLILGVYNRFDSKTGYDRAVFFFDKNDVLTDHASHVQD